MNPSSTRRRLLAASAASLAALGAGSVLSRLLGQSKARATMQTTTTAETSATPRKIERVLSSTSEHWVGDGFRVRSVISPDGDPRVQSPFLLLDHAPSRHFAPATTRRGVGEHPHRGFETVTLAYRGEIEHRDSAGGGGIIGPGDVQWMTAASGIVHEEKHSHRFTEQGGELEMVQLWVNLPARAKRSPPGYQSLLDKDFPRLQLGAAQARLIAGSLAGQVGPARTHSPITLFDLQFTEAGVAEFELPASHTAMTFPLAGQVAVGADEQVVAPGQLAVLERHGSGLVRVLGEKDARVLVLSGEPIDEPVAAYGPFVMNTREEIMQAMRDYQSGKMGHLHDEG
jgi:redox-sensitive bicupin YhaK (pirin superfamily)